MANVFRKRVRVRLTVGIVAVAAGCGSGPRTPEPAPVIPIPVAVVKNPNVIQRRETDEYEIRGSTMAELSAQMAKGGPAGDGRRYAGMHNSRYRYSYTTTMRSGACAAKATVELYSVTTLPKWVDSASASPQVQAEWGTFMKYIRAHEDNHRLIAFYYTSQLQKELVDIVAPSCQMLADDIKRLSDKLNLQGRRAQEDYDGRTNHGRTELAALRRSVSARPDSVRERED